MSEIAWCNGATPDLSLRKMPQTSRWRIACAEFVHERSLYTITAQWVL